MKLPRDLSGLQLAKKRVGWGEERTPTKTLIRTEMLGFARLTPTYLLTTLEHGEHHVTIPAHNSLKVGTLAAILAEIANHFGISREELFSRLFR